MYFIFRHSESSGYKDKKGKYYHFTTESPNYEKVKPNAKVLLYQKELDAIFGYADISRVKEKKMGRGKEFFAFYKNYKELKEPLFCEELIEKGCLNIELAENMSGIIPIKKEVYLKILELIKSKETTV